MSARRSAPPVDLRSPFALDVHELDRRPGSMQQLSRELPAPGDWAVGLVAVPPDAPVGLRLRLESVMEGILVNGTVTAPVTADCGRCLTPMSDAVEAPLQELFAYEPEPGDDDIPVISGDVLDLEPAVRDAVLLALPLKPLCRADCPGLCTRCGQPLAELPADHAHDDTDPRWAALGALRLTPTEES